jgi:hypothetical protein
MANHEKLPSHEAKKTSLFMKLGFIALLAAGINFLFGPSGVTGPKPNNPH